jgi:uncharacterized DUF497 family protein
MEFEWDDGKAAANARKHGVTFHEAACVFDDPLAVTYPDPDQSEGEARFITFGLSSEGRLLAVSHAELPDGVRLIGAPGNAQGAHNL